MTAFRYEPDVLLRYPNLVGGIILAQNMNNTSTPADFTPLYEAEQKAVLERLGDTPLSQLESISAWRSAFREFGVDPTQYRCAAEALLRRLTKKGDIPHINLLVDLGNLVSIRYALPIAIVDTRDVTGDIRVHFAAGTERFTPLGESAIEQPEPGEVVFSDDTAMVVARRWCWRQSAESAARDDTTQAIITIEAHHAAALHDVEAAMRDMLDLLSRHAGGDYQAFILGKDKPATD